MDAASEIVGLMNVEGVNYEVRVRNTFIHVCERSPRRRLSAPAVLNFDTAVAQVTYDGRTHSLNEYVSDGEARESNFHDRWDGRPRHLSIPFNLNDTLAPREIQGEAASTSGKFDHRQRDGNSRTLVGDAPSALDDCAYSMNRLRASHGRNSFVDGNSRTAQAVSLKSKGPRGSARSKTVTRMFIGNLPCSMSTDRMEVELCKHGFFGTYTSVDLPCKGKGIGRGFGFVSFSSAEEAKRFASVFKGCEFDGQRCYVNPAARQGNPCVPYDGHMTI